MEERYREGGFTLPGEAGYEELTLELAQKWGADVIRDSDGTKLSDEILNAGYRVYSTICIIREHNAFAKAHPDAQQQTFLCSRPVLAQSTVVVIPLLDGYSKEQFELNISDEAMGYWQVHDRTTGQELPRDCWNYADGCVTVQACVPWHQYTASFLCWRIWEEINMYNHTTNGWTSEHLRQLDPRHPAAWAYMKQWLEDWCVANPQTDVIRLTSLFYNFVWIWGDTPQNRNRFTDWASYDFTVSPAALYAFEQEYGYALSAEDFVQGGKRQATHRPPTKAKRDYMAFIQRFVAEKARELVEIIHRHGKQAYVFYDDSWVGMEPYGAFFKDIGFDGLIKCVFSGFECRLCAGVDVPVHELRFHPYLFPVGLGGLPTFCEGGDPTRDARAYWAHVRRALLRQCVDRIGLGGYLHLVRDFPDFCDEIERIGVEFRQIRELHAHGAPQTLPCRVAVLHTWGALRSWTLSGHFHETDNHALIHVIEALAGLPVQVRFIDFEEVGRGALSDVDVLISAGRAGDAWSGGDAWKNPDMVAQVTRFVHEGGTLIGVGEPSAVEGASSFLRLAHILGVDVDTGAYTCHGRMGFVTEKEPPFTICADGLGNRKDIFLTDGASRVLCEKDGVPQMVLHPFGQGTGVYMSDFRFSQESARMLLEILLHVRGLKPEEAYLSDSDAVETAYFPTDRTLIAINNAETVVRTQIMTPDGTITLELSALETRMIRL